MLPLKFDKIIFCDVGLVDVCQRVLNSGLSVYQMSIIDRHWRALLRQLIHVQRTCCYAMIASCVCGDDCWQMMRSEKIASLGVKNS